ncbi:uncharacterized protein LOC131685244 [Topomyia yanbarensis]|uniref:uncharacterized protein LOC131685244 n=1 Tax=Topomyia yanbarensis TaxID=2498891 RepID=UPI00273C9181|nr:uncharacterized protein LOC131685244 [Topomyia yanbarensis]
MYKNPILTKVPGDVTRGLDKEKQGYLQQLSKLSKTELLDLKNRQELLLQNRHRIAKLPDQGAKIKKFYDQILNQLEAYKRVDQAAEMFSELNIASVGKKTMTKMEWNGKYSRDAQSETVIDSDDDYDDSNVDPLHILAQNTASDKKVVILKPPQMLITEQDLKDIEEMKQQKLQCTDANLVEVDLKATVEKFGTVLKKMQKSEANDSVDEAAFDGYAIKFCQKERNSGPKQKYLPFKTTRTNVHDPAKEKQRYLQHANVWENTAATPPLNAHGPAKLLTLEDSIRIQAEKNKIHEQVMQRYSEDRLKRREEIKEKVLDTIRTDVMPGSTGFTTYRDVSDSGEESEESIECESDTHDD